MDSHQEKKITNKQHQRFTIDGPCFNKGGDCEPILRSLPAWFGIEQAIAQYVTDIDHLPTFLVYESGEVIRFLSIKQHYATSAEIYVMGIRQDVHRHGIGRA